MKPTTETVKEIESPSGLDLHPQPPSPVRLSKRAGILVLVSSLQSPRWSGTASSRGAIDHFKQVSIRTMRRD